MEQMSHGTMSGKCLRMKGVALRIFRLTLQEIIKEMFARALITA